MLALNQPFHSRVEIWEPFKMKFIRGLQSWTPPSAIVWSGPKLMHLQIMIGHYLCSQPFSNFVQLGMCLFQVDILLPCLAIYQRNPRIAHKIEEECYIIEVLTTLKSVFVFLAYAWVSLESYQVVSLAHLNNYTWYILFWNKFLRTKRNQNTCIWQFSGQGSVWIFLG